jgi:hypothetical protein
VGSRAGGLYCKKLRICNLREIGRFRSKQVIFSLDKYKLA